MPFYSFKAKNQQREAVSGREFFESERKLAESLRSRGLNLISAAPDESFKKRRLLFGSVSLTDKLMFTRNFRVMISAAMPITRILETLMNQVRSKKFAAIINEINEKLKRGDSLAKAFSGYPEIFDEIYVSMIRTGESGSNLEAVLTVLEEQLRRDYELRSKVKGAMIYPIVIVSALIGVGGAIIVFVMPRLARAFMGLGVELPFTLKIFIWLNDAMSKNWLLAIFILLALAVLSRFLITFHGLKKVRDKFILGMPIFGNISRQINTARFARTFSSLISGGVPVYQAFNITANTLSNFFFSRSLREAAAAVQRGQPIHNSLDGDLWPPTVTAMVAVGEETGKLSDILKELALFYEEEVANTVKNLSSIIEPVLMIVIGLAIGIFAVSVIIPIYSIISTF